MVKLLLFFCWILIPNWQIILIDPLSVCMDSIVVLKMIYGVCATKVGVVCWNGGGVLPLRIDLTILERTEKKQKK